MLQLDLPEAVLDALGGSYERWDGRGWPGVLAGDAIPIASRVIQLAEFVEVAHRVGGIDAAVTLAQRRRATQFDPLVVDTMCLDAAKVFGEVDDVGSWDTVIDAEPSLAIALTATAMRRRALGDQPLRRPEVTVHARALNGGRRTCRRRGASSSVFQTMRCTCCIGPDWCTTSADWAYRTRSGTSAARSVPANGNECECTPTSPSEFSSNHRRSNHSPASRCSTASGSTAPAIREA